MASRSPPPLSTIAVVDDDDAVLNALDFALSAEGYRVRSFHTAKAMYECADIDEAACLVIDQFLSDEPGLALLARLRARGDRAPAVLITTDPQRTTVLEAARLGVPIVEKPLLGDHLFACIRGLIDAADARGPAPRP